LLQDNQPNERRRKAGQTERTHREGHGIWAGSVKTFRELAMLKTAPLTCETKGDLRVKRRDPWLGANAPPKAVADPELSGQDAEKTSQTCLGLVRRPVAQPPVKAS
jgi:hypothetical protein